MKTGKKCNAFKACEKEKGMGLVDSMIGLFIMLLVSAGLMRMVQFAGRSAQAMSSITSRKGMEDLVRLLAQDSGAAQKTLAVHPVFADRLKDGCPTGVVNTGPLNLRNSGDATVLPKSFNRGFAACTANCAFAMTASWGCDKGSYWIDVRTTYAANLGLPGYDAKGGSVVSRMPIDGAMWREGVIADPEAVHDKVHLEFYPSNNFKAVGGDIKVKVSLIYKESDCVHTFDLCGTTLTAPGGTITTADIAANPSAWEISKVFKQGDKCRPRILTSGTNCNHNVNLSDERVAMAKLGQNLWRVGVEDWNDWDWQDSVWKVRACPTSLAGC